MPLEKSDLWNFDSTLARFLADGLHEFVGSLSGAPAEYNGIKDATCALDAWETDLRLHASQFQSYASADFPKPDISESFLWLALNYQDLWD